MVEATTEDLGIPTVLRGYLTHKSGRRRCCIEHDYALG